MIEKRAGVNASAPDGTTALHWASHWDDLETASLLIQADANVNAATDLGVTPLYLACVNGSAGMVEKLVRAGANVKAVLSTGESALMTCARSGNVDAVKTLLSHGAGVNASEKSHNQTALMWAVSERHPGVVQVLLEHGADVRARSLVWREFVLRSELVKGKSEGEWIDRGGSTALLFAARSGDIDSTKLLLAAGADPNMAAPDGNTALLIAAHSGHSDVAELLLEKGADSKACGTGYTALHLAVLKGDLGLVKALLARGADPNAQLTNGAPLRRVDSDPVLPADLAGATPFLLAAKYADASIMRELMAAGAKPSIAMKDGTTALMAAAGVGWAGGVDRRGANLIAAPPSDEKEALEAVKLTIESGADVTAANDAGDTALHGAAAKGYNSIVQLLADRGAKLAAKNRKGQTPLAMTRTTKSSFGQASLKSTAALLTKLGAVDDAPPANPDKAKKK